VSFAQAVYFREINIEGILGRLTSNVKDAQELALAGIVPVIADPEFDNHSDLRPDVLVDARMLKRDFTPERFGAELMVGLGPGFYAAVDCDAVVETKRGPNLGRVYWRGTAEEDSGIPEAVGDVQSERVLRSPGDGIVRGDVQIGAFVEAGECVVFVGDIAVKALFAGYVRGVIQPGLYVKKGTKIADIDPRDDQNLCFRVSDKALAVGGGVLEAVLSWRSFQRCVS
jgi:xanthine dehydrogenase accessory factor